MSWLERLAGRAADRPDWLPGDAPWARRVASLLEGRKFREAASELASSTTPVPPETHLGIARAASEHWLADAEAACQAGDRDRMNAALAEAARWYQDALGPLFRDTRRRIRQHTLELTTANHWVELLRAAADQRERAAGPPPAAWRSFANERLLEEPELGPDPIAGVERADRATLARLAPRVARTYPDALRAGFEGAHPELIRGALLVAGGRPDLAIVPLLEAPDGDPLVCLERARVAWSLGFPGTAMLALADFAAHHGGHTTVRRLNTGVFMAQMAVAAGDEERAVEILGGLPLHEVGRRPILLYARLLARVGRGADGVAVLEDWLAAHPADAEAFALLQDLAGPDPTEEGLIEEAPRSDGPSRG